MLNYCFYLFLSIIKHVYSFECFICRVVAISQVFAHFRGYGNLFNMKELKKYINIHYTLIKLPYIVSISRALVECYLLLARFYLLRALV